MLVGLLGYRQKFILVRREREKEREGLLVVNLRFVINVSIDVHWNYLQSKTIYKVDYAITKK